MKKADMQVYKDRLLMLRARLHGDVSAMADAALRNSGLEGDSSTMPIHMAELGSENFEQEFTLSLVATEEDTLAQIDAALQRISDGSFGKCTGCGGVVPKTRLNALPFTPMCIKCAEQNENGK